MLLTTDFGNLAVSLPGIALCINDGKEGPCNSLRGRV